MRGSNTEESHAHLSQPRMTDTVCTGGSRRHRKYASPHRKERSDESEPPKPMKTPRIEDLVEMVRKRIHDIPQSRNGSGSSILRISDSPLLDKITSHRFSKKFVIPSFDCYTRVINLVHHIRAYQVKIVVHSYDDFLTCRVFSSSLKGLVLNWFYSLPPRYLRSFEGVSDAFLNQYASQQKFKNNSNYLFMVRMKKRKTLKRYISHFQSQIALVYNCMTMSPQLPSSPYWRSIIPFTNTW